jgi:hypothetical protein
MIDKTDQRPRSRKYDIWLFGCVFLEFTIWLLHGPKAIEGFACVRGNNTLLTNFSAPLYEVTDRTARAARVYPLAPWTIERLEGNPQCKGRDCIGSPSYPYQESNAATRSRKTLIGCGYLQGA